jgi:hypothetical protein
VYILYTILHFYPLFKLKKIKIGYIDPKKREKNKSVWEGEMNYWV